MYPMVCSLAGTAILCTYDDSILEMLGFGVIAESILIDSCTCSTLWSPVLQWDGWRGSVLAFHAALVYQHCILVDYVV